jgi:hypothetical protein
MSQAFSSRERCRRVSTLSFPIAAAFYPDRPEHPPESCDAADSSSRRSVAAPFAVIIADFLSPGRWRLLPNSSSGDAAPCHRPPPAELRPICSPTLEPLRDYSSRFCPSVTSNEYRTTGRSGKRFLRECRRVFRKTKSQEKSITVIDTMGIILAFRYYILSAFEGEAVWESSCPYP